MRMNTVASPSRIRHRTHASMTKLTLEKRAAEVISLLKKAYPAARCALNFSSPEELLVATILSAQSTDSTVNLVTPVLFSTFPVPDRLAGAPISDIERIIKPCGYYHQKARYIKGTCAMLLNEYGGKVPRSLDKLLSLPGVARKTANVVLSVAFGINEGIAVDTHVLRLSGRLGFTFSSNPVIVEKELMQIVERKNWGDFTTLLITHGRKICTARRPLCGNCTLNRVCPSAFTFSPAQAIHHRRRGA